MTIDTAKQRAVIKALHTRYKIPEDYFRTLNDGRVRRDTDVEPIDGILREQGVRALEGVGIIDEINDDAVLGRLVDRLDLLLSRSDMRGKR